MTAHSVLGASSASRWMNCPGSVSLSADLPDKTSVFAAEGTAAHALAEMTLLDNNAWPTDFIGIELEGFTVTREMAEAVAVYVREVRERVNSNCDVMIEARVNLEAAKPPKETGMGLEHELDPMFGTADCLIYDRETQLLTVMDYKHGAGVAVGATNNAQLRYYALGAMYVNENWKPKDVAMVIVQPRATHSEGPVRFDSIGAVDLILWGYDLFQAAQRTITDTETYQPGSWCRFCKAAYLCPSLQRQALEAAQVEFDADEQPRGPKLLTDVELSQIMAKVETIEFWLKAVKDEVLARLNKGNDVPGWKLVQKRAMRKWSNPDEVVDALRKAGCEDEELFEMKLRSPAQLEKVVGKEAVADFITKESGGLTMASESDKRPAVKPLDDFLND